MYTGLYTFEGVHTSSDVWGVHPQNSQTYLFVLCDCLCECCFGQTSSCGGPCKMIAHSRYLTCYETGYVQFTASRPQQNAAKTTPAITKHCCQTCHALFTHITPVLKQLHWLPIEQRIIFKISMFVFKTIHGVSPTYLCSLVKPYDPFRGNTRSANKLLLTEHKSKNSRERDVHRIRSEGLEYTSKQYQRQRNNQYLKDSTENTSFQSLL